MSNRDVAIETRGQGDISGQVSGVSIRKNGQRFIACTLYMQSVEWSKGAMDGVVSNSSSGSKPCEVCSVLNHRLYTKLVNAFPGLCGHCLFYRVKILKQTDTRNTLITRAEPRTRRIARLA